MKKHNDFILLQETHLEKNEEPRSVLAHQFRNWGRFMSNGDNGRAGIITMVAPHIQKKYNIEQIKLSQDIQGHLIILHFTPNTLNPHLIPFISINIYLPTKEKTRLRHATLQALAALKKADRIIMGGDFNFEETSDDNGGSRELGGLSTRDAALWRAFAERHRLQEVYQPTHTYYRYDKKNKEIHSSRLDRFYITTSTTETILANPTTFIPNIPFHSLRLHKLKAQGKRSAPFAAAPDHYPVSLNFITPLSTKRREHNLPAWIFKMKGFADAFKASWKKEGYSFTTANHFKTHLTNTIKKIIHKKNNNSLNSEMRVLNGAIKLYKHANNSNFLRYDHILSLLQHSPSLHNCIDPLTTQPDLQLTKDFIETLYTENNKNYNDNNNQDITNEQIQTNNNRNTNIIKNIAINLPSDRKRLTHINVEAPGRDDEGSNNNSNTPNDTPITDPNEQAEIITQTYDKIWGKSEKEPRKKKIKSYLDKNNYHNKIQEDYLPNKPTKANTPTHQHTTNDWRNVIRQTIKLTNDSCPGPDGIPFIAYRLLIDITTDFLLEMLIEISNNNKPPTSFNQGRLFLIPKDDSFYADHTRPITVNNSDNRIIASTLAEVITPAMQNFLDLSQKGFIPGRTGNPHITDLNDAYYTAIQKKLLHFILFLDTRKAFDSIHHKYLLYIIKRIGLPSWFCNSIKMLLHFAHVIPVLAAKVNCPIFIRRGVKQGCPLSPFLFAISYDPLLRQLNKINNLTNHAFADDLACSSGNLDSILKATKIIQAFSEISGLGINAHKTKIMPSRKINREMARRIRRRGAWNKIIIAPRYTYLGVLMGHNIDTGDIFQMAFDKFKRKACAYARIISHTPPAHRTLFFNVFLISLFSYLIHFYIIPNDITKKINAICARHLVPFHGFAYQHLVTLQAVRYRTPLHDIWALNTARLAAQHKLSSYNGATPPLVINDKRYLRENWHSLLITDQIDGAASDYLNYYHPPIYDNTLNTENFEINERKTRSLIYYNLVNNAYRSYDDDPNNYQSLLFRVRRWGFHSTMNICANAGRAPRSLPPHYIAHYKHTLLWVLPTHYRLSKANIWDWQVNHSDGACLLCGDLPATATANLDAIAHLYGDCKVVVKANILFHIDLGLQTRNQELQDSLMAREHISAKEVAARLTFNFAVWEARRRIFAPLKEAPTPDEAVDILEENAIREWNKHAAKGKRVDRRQRRITGRKRKKSKQKNKQRDHAPIAQAPHRARRHHAPRSHAPSCQAPRDHAPRKPNETPHREPDTGSAPLGLGPTVLYAPALEES